MYTSTHHIICAVQHNTKTCVICTGVVSLALPAAIELYYHLALIAAWNAWNASSEMEAYYIDYTRLVHKTYETYPERENSLSIAFSAIHVSTRDL